MAMTVLTSVRPCWARRFAIHARDSSIGDWPASTAVIPMPTPEGQNLAERLVPRQYQTELFQEARKRNVIAYLDTGSGKTLISVMIINDKAEGLMADGCKKITVFLAPKVLLVQQQAEVLRKHTRLRVSQYTGDMNVTSWDQQKWNQELQEHDVWVMTPQILLDALRLAFVRIDDLNLLIFDKCHGAIKRDPSNCIMQEFYHDSKNKKPRPHIFGMTASPVNTRPQDTEMKLTQTMQQLERNLDAQIITVINRDPVIAAAPLPELKLVNYSCKHDSDAMQTLQVRLDHVIWSLQQGETTMAQLAAARSQQAAEAASIPLQLDEEKLETVAVVVRRHIQGLALTLEDSGLWVACAVLQGLLSLVKPTTFWTKSVLHLTRPTRGEQIQDT
ncbi:hypothetical protein WJX82_008855 [Trebouxia sp. C0006]